MSTSPSDDLIKYLTNRKNLRYTLDILSKSDEIRKQVFCEFWREAQNMLRGSIPKSLSSRKLAWALWPGEKQMDTESAGVYIYRVHSRLPELAEVDIHSPQDANVLQGSLLA